MLIVPIIVTVALITLGAVIRTGKASWLIAGYNTLSKAEKETYDEKAMSRFVGNLLIVLAFMQLLIGVTIYLKAMQMMVVVLMLLFGVIIGAVVYMNTGSRFRKIK